MKDIVAIILAGGKGERLHPLTKDRSKPAVYFGGIYRIIDITLSNCVNSEIFRIMLFPQYKSQSLIEHIEFGWNIFNRYLGHYLRVVHPQMRISTEWYRGTADSVRQNLYLIERESTGHFLILSGDHIYKMNYDYFKKFHVEVDADLTISAIEIDIKQAHKYGVLEVDEQGKVIGFEEKPAEPKCIPGKPDKALISMGIYLFKREPLIHFIREVKGDDFGKHIIPDAIKTAKVYAYDYGEKNMISDFLYHHFEDGRRERYLEERVPDSNYWRDVGDLDSFWSANMDLTGVNPAFNLYSVLWPLRTSPRQYPPVKTIFQIESEGRVGGMFDSIVSPGTVISGGKVNHSVLSYNVRVNSWAQVSDSVLMPDVQVGRYCQLKNAIIDKNNNIPQNTVIGYDLEEDKKRFTVSKGGIVVVEKGYFS